MSLESLRLDVRYAVRNMRRSPLFAASVAATIGLGLGVLCSAFTILNAYFFKPIDLPRPDELYALSWDTDAVRRHAFGLADFDALRASAPHFAGLAAEQEATVMRSGLAIGGLLVTGNYFQLLGARAEVGRLLTPGDAAVPGAAAVAVLSHWAWQSQYGSDPAIIGATIQLGQQRFEVVGVAERGFGLSGREGVSFWVPLTMARGFGGTDPWTERDTPALRVVGRVHERTTGRQVQAWLDVWLRQRFPAGSDGAPVAVRVESLARRLPLTGAGLTLMSLLASAFGLVLLVACANVTNLLLARAFGRQQEIAVRMSLGASAWRVARQLMIESLVLAVPASAVGLALTFVTARVFPALILGTIPADIGPVQAIMVPLDPDIRVLAVLFGAAVVSAVAVSLSPALRLTRANIVRASKGEGALDIQGSRLRTGLVAMQIGACVLFLVMATGLVNVSRRMASPDAHLSYENVSFAIVAPRLRGPVAARLRSDPAVEHLAAAWRAPLVGPMTPIGVVASRTRTEQNAGFMVVSPEYFELFDIRVVRGRVFTAQEAEAGAPVALVSEATARALWPGLDPLDQTLDLVPPRGRVTVRRPAHSNARIIGVTEDVVSGLLLEGVDKTCVYFATGINAPGDLAILVRGRGDMATLKASVTAAVNAVEPEAPFQFIPIRTVMGVIAWTLQAFTVSASFLGVIGLLLAFSGTYAVVAFLVTQRTREFGIRMALGASVRQIITRIVSETMRTATMGMAAGLAVAAAVARLFSATIQIIPRFELGPYVVGVTIVAAATAAAALFPSLRTTRIDPAKALRVD